jgi:beta-phosphoglucomutase-like phosphatase (HAD superfamily)
MNAICKSRIGVHSQTWFCLRLYTGTKLLSANSKKNDTIEDICKESIKDNSVVQMDRKIDMRRKKAKEQEPSQYISGSDLFLKWLQQEYEIGGICITQKTQNIIRILVEKLDWKRIFARDET